MSQRFETVLAKRFAALADPIDDSDWADVRGRAETSRPHRRGVWVALAAALAAVAILLVGPALGLPGKVIRLFESGEPAPERVEKDFASLDTAAPEGMAPGVIRGQTRKVTTVRLSSGHEVALWVAPTRREGFCTNWEELFGGCMADRAEYLERGLLLGVTVAEPGSTGPYLLGGEILTESGAASLEVRYRDGERADIPLVWVSEPINAGFFLFEVPRTNWETAARPVAVVALDEDGKEVARQELPGPQPFAPVP